MTTALLLLLSCKPDIDLTGADWQLVPFEKEDDANPVLEPLPSSIFYCPVREDTVSWESKDVFNPSAIVRNDTVFIIYRAEDRIGRYNGTSRLGLAWSTDGLNFNRLPNPVFYPDNDAMKVYEWEGGVEDPRVVEDPDGQYIMTYTAYDGETARLCVARSPDLVNWKKYGPAFKDPAFKDLWSKSGSIVTREEKGRMIAHKVNGQYWMYWGDTRMFVATSRDLINWTPVTDGEEMVSVFGPREGMFDSRLVEPGPPAMITKYGILLLYNGMNLVQGGDPELPAGNYAAGQALLDPDDPTRLLARSDHYFITPDREYEITGQVGNVCFIEGLARLGGRYLLYYGTADSKIAVAVKD